MSVTPIAERVLAGDRLSGEEALRLYTDASTALLGRLADSIRARKHPAGRVTMVQTSGLRVIRFPADYGGFPGCFELRMGKWDSACAAEKDSIHDVSFRVQSRPESQLNRFSVNCILSLAAP